LKELEMTNMHNPPHPGEVLREWLADISVTDAARRLGVTRVALSRVLNGSAGISADMDLRLSKALGTTPGSWYAMQANYDMSRAKRHFRAKVQRIATPSKESGTAEAPG
jgi:addiction module HigA family antidote